MRRALLAALLVLGALAVSAMPAVPAAPPRDHALVGTWEYDPAASMFDGAIPYRSATIRFEPTAAGIHVVAHIVEGPGRVLHFEYVDRGDGAFVPVTGNPFYDSQRTHWTAGKAERTERRGATVTGTTLMEVARDGRSFVARADRTLPNGRRYRSAITWRRVAER